MRWCRRCGKYHDGPTKYCEACKAEQRSRFATLSPEARAARNASKRALRAKSRAPRGNFKKIVLETELPPDTYDWEPSALELSFMVQRARNDDTAEDQARHWAAMQAFYDVGASSTDVAKRFGVGAGRAWKILQATNTKMRDRGAATSVAMNARPEYDRRRPDKQRQVPPEAVAFFVAGGSLAATAKKFDLGGQPYTALKRALSEAGVALRSSAEQWVLMFNPDGSKR